MEVYKKPVVASNNTSGIIPVVLSPVPVSPIPTFLSPFRPIAAAVAKVISNKGNNIIDSMHTSTLTARKNFLLA